MNHHRAWLAMFAVALFAGSAGAFDESVRHLNRRLAGKVVEYTKRGGVDRRIFSTALCLRREMLVYLPPNYDPRRAYPLLLWLHGFGGNEMQFARQVVDALDQAIVCGKMPPVIAACPDGSLPPTLTRPWHSGSWFINSRQGRWEDYLIDDVLGFLEQNYNLRPEREARIVGGWSMGGFAAYRLAFKYPHLFRLAVGCYANLDLCYEDCRGSSRSNFDPNCLGRLSELTGHHVIGYYPYVHLPIFSGLVYRPVWGVGEQAIARFTEENPYELLERMDIQPGMFDLFVAYGGRDNYNLDAQAQSFLHRARQRGLDVWTRFNPKGRHHTTYVNECMPDILAAVGARLHELLPKLAQRGSQSDADVGWKSKAKLAYLGQPKLTRGLNSAGMDASRH